MYFTYRAAVGGGLVVSTMYMLAEVTAVTH